MALTALAVSLLVLAADKVPEAPTGPNPFLVQARDLYSKLEFEKCLKRVSQAQQWRSSPKELLEIELYAGLCHFNLGQKPDAEERFKTALRIDPAAELPPYTTPRAVEIFNKLKRSMKPVVVKEKKEEKEEKKEKEKEKEKERPPPDREKEREVPSVVESPPEEKEPVKSRPEPKPETAEVKQTPKEKEVEKAWRDEPDETRPAPKKSDAPTAKKLTPTRSPEEEVVTPSRPSWAASKAPAIALTSVAAVGLGVGLGFGLASQDLQARAKNAAFESDFYALKKKAEVDAVGANISYGVAATAAIVAVVLWVTGN
jgi:hypothetical protein